MRLKMLFVISKTKSILRITVLSLFASILTFAELSYSSAGESGHAHQEESITQSPSVQKMVRDGVAVEFRITPDEAQDVVMEGKYADVEFRISDAQTGEPVKGIYPAVWLDIAKPWDQPDLENTLSCKKRVSQYMQSMIGARPLVDLNSYFVLVMNQNASVSVIDPIVSVAGMTKLYTVINLLAPGAEWVKSLDENTMFISMPSKGKVAQIDLTTFEVTTNIDAGDYPLRVDLQPDGEYLWVTNNHRDSKKSGVSVIDVAGQNKIKFIATGAGHHELAFSQDSRFAYVSNRDDGSVVVIDTASLEIIKTIAVGKQVIDITYSGTSESLYATDGKAGIISVIDTNTQSIVKRIDVKIGVGPAGVTQQGRWMIAANSEEDEVYAVEVATNELVHTIPVGRKPYQIAFSRAYVYIRSLGTEKVSMFDISQLKNRDKVPVASFGVGTNAPGKAGEPSLASAIHEAPGEAAVLVVSPTDNTVYYYMEGMTAPMGNFANEGYRPRAVQVADRTLREEKGGVYHAKVRSPAAGTYDVAFLMESPSIVHCFNMSAERNPDLRRNAVASLEFIGNRQKVNIGDEVTVKFRITDPETSKHKSDLKDVRVRYYRAPSFDRKEVAAIEVGDGVYKLDTKLSRTGVYYFFVSSKASNLAFGGDMPYLSMQVTRPVVSSN
jgi:YVTN family beta-propeller protein